MARGINKVILVGNIGKDPEVKATQGGKTVVSLSLATAESWKDKQTGQKQERTEWHRLVFFGKVAEIAGQYLKKGSQVYIEGRLQTRKWQGQDGQDRYTTEIVVNDMKMLGGHAGGGQQQQQGQQQQPPAWQQQQQQPHHQQQQPPAWQQPQGQQQQQQGQFQQQPQGQQQQQQGQFQQPPQGQQQPQQGQFQQPPQGQQQPQQGQFQQPPQGQQQAWEDDIPF